MDGGSKSNASTPNNEQQPGNNDNIPNICSTQEFDFRFPKPLAPIESTRDSFVNKRSRNSLKSYQQVKKLEESFNIKASKPKDSKRVHSAEEDSQMVFYSDSQGPL